MDHLETEGRNPASERLDDLTPLELVRLMNAEDARVVEAVGTQAEKIAQAIEVIADRLKRGGRLVYVGAGTSGRLGVLDASECPPTFSSPPEQVIGLIAGGLSALTRAVEGAEDHPEYAEQDLQAIGLCSKDVVVGIATSGRTPYVLGAVAYARRVGAYAIGLACTTAAELTDQVDLALVPVVGPEILTGSTRLKAGTATKLILNMLSTGAMVRLGKTFGNLMVDLRATNSKLKARTNRIVRQLTGLDHEAADALLQQCGGELKTALVVALTRVTPEEARKRLHEADGQVRGALPELERPADPELVLGIDGGGTRTVALLARQDHVLGRGEAGPSNRQAVGDAAALTALEQAVQRAFAAAGLERQPVRQACLGLAGAGRAEDRDWVQRWARRYRLAEQVEVVADVALLLAAGTPEGWGLALIAGTGSIAWGRAPDGREARAGGWGHLLGDEGSGYALAMEVLRSAARAADGREPMTALHERIKDHLQIRELSELIPLLHSGKLDRTRIASLAPLILEAEDPAITELLNSHANHLAAAALAVARKLALPSPFPLALAGSLLLRAESYRARILHCLSRTAQVAPITLVQEPAEGAIRLACKAISTA